MEYVSQRLKFSSYSDGVTPHIGSDGYWYFGTQKTEHKASGTDGISFDGVAEYYLATLATDCDDSGKPNVPSFSKTSWKTSIASTGFGTKNGNDILYKYLWNVEEIKSKDGNGLELPSTYTNPDLMDIYSGGRIPKGYTSYYTAGTSHIAPGKQPELYNDGNLISVPVGSTWTTNIETVPDANTYLFEITFVEYSESDENGKNTFAKLAGPTLIGRNGAGVVLSLDNDYDSVARNSLGTIISTLPITVGATLHEGTVLKECNITMVAPGEFMSNGALNSAYATYSNNTLTIKNIPNDFVSGVFKFSYEGFSKNFSLSVVPSEVDYDLIVDNTNVDSSLAGFVIIKVKKTDVNGSTEFTKSSDSNEIKLYKREGDIEKELTGEWKFNYDKGRLEPVTFIIKDTRQSGSITWDEEVVNFHRDTTVKKIEADLITKTQTGWKNLTKIELTAKNTDLNKKICINDQVYFSGVVSDVFASNDEKTNQSIDVYGIVESINNNVFTIKVTELKWGGSIGEKGEDSVAYWLVRDSAVIVKNNDQYTTTSITFTPMKQIGSKEPDVCGTNDNIKLRIWVDEAYGAHTDYVGAKKIELGEGNGKLKPLQALHCMMLLGDVKVDEESAEVLADGVTISSIDYAVNDSGATEPSGDWSPTFPTNISQGSFLWTRTTYSNGLKAYTSAYQAKDGKDAVATASLSLSNDMDMIPADSDGVVDANTALDGATTRVEAYKNGVLDSNASITCVVVAGTTTLQAGTDYTFVNNTFRLERWENTTNPWNNVIATFEYKTEVEEEEVKVTKTFKMTKICAEEGKPAIDYYLEVSPNSKNTTFNNGTIDIYAKKKEGTTISNISGQTGIVVKEGTTTLTTENGKYTYSYDRYQSGEITFILEVNGVKWDEETLLLVTNGQSAKDLNLLADSYFFTKKKDGTIQPASIQFTTQSSGLTGNYTWIVNGTTKTNVDTTGTHALQNTNITGQTTVKVTRDGLEDTIIIGYLEEAEDGKDAIGIQLTNPSMTFNSTTSTIETCSAIVMIGTQSASYTNTTPTASSTGLKYTLSGYDSIDNLGVMTISKPSANISKPITIKVYKDGTLVKEQTINIHCIVVDDGSSPYFIDLSNDSAVIVTDKDGNNGAYGENAKTTATVYCGSKEDTGWSFSVSPSSSTNLTYELSNNNRTVEVTGMDDDSGELTFTATKTGCPTQTKVFKVSKLKQGNPGSSATSYWLISSLNSIAMYNNGSYKDTQLTFTAKKQTGGGSPITHITKLEIYKDNNTSPTQSSANTGVSISNGVATINLNTLKPMKSVRCVMYYTLFSTTIVDEEKVFVTKDGTNGTGTKGDTEGTITLYQSSGESTSAPDIYPAGTELKGWSETEPTPSSTDKYIWKIIGSYTKTAGSSDKTYGTSWSTPELHSAYYGTRVDGQTAATYYKLFGLGKQSDGMKYDDQGNLFINAKMINTGTFTVTNDGTDTGDVLFSAGWDAAGNGIVKIGGWQATENSIVDKNDQIGLYSQDTMPFNSTYARIMAGSKTISYTTDTVATNEFTRSTIAPYSKTPYSATVETYQLNNITLPMSAEYEIDCNDPYDYEEISIDNPTKQLYLNSFTFDDCYTVIVRYEDNEEVVGFLCPEFNYTDQNMSIKKDAKGEYYIEYNSSSSQFIAGTWFVYYTCVDDGLTTIQNNKIHEHPVLSNLFSSWDEDTIELTLKSSDLNQSVSSEFTITHNEEGVLGQMADDDYLIYSYMDVSSLQLVRQSQPSSNLIICYFNITIPRLSIKYKTANNSFEDYKLYSSDLKNITNTIDLSKGKVWGEGAVLQDTQNNSTGLELKISYKTITKVQAPFVITKNGHLYATGGKIGGWEIDEIAPDSGEIGILKRSKNQSTGITYTTGMAAKGDGSSVAFWAGCQGGTPWEVTDDFYKKTGFLVTEDGKLYATGATISGYVNAQSGKFGSLTVNSSGLSASTWSLTDAGLVMTQGSELQIGTTKLWVEDTTKTNIASSGELWIFSRQTEAGILLGSQASSENIGVSSCEYSQSDNGFAADTFTIKLTFKKIVPQNTTFSLYWYCYASDGKSDNYSGTISFTATGTGQTVFEKEVECNTFIGKPVQYIGFSFDSSNKAKERAESLWFDAEESHNDTELINGVKYIKIKSDSSISVVLRGDMLPWKPSIYTLGNEGSRWSQIWCTQGSINSSSDKNLKKDIENIPDIYNTFFDLLSPVRYKFIVNESNRYHFGLISQDVEESLQTANISSQDFAGFIKWKNEEGVEEYGLRYGEFIALNIWQIQKAKSRISTLEQTILNYEFRISSLETEIQNLKSS